MLTKTPWQVAGSHFLFQELNMFAASRAITASNALKATTVVILAILLLPAGNRLVAQAAEVEEVEVRTHEQRITCQIDSSQRRRIWGVHESLCLLCLTLSVGSFVYHRFIALNSSLSTRRSSMIPPIKATPPKTSRSLLRER